MEEDELPQHKRRCYYSSSTTDEHVRLVRQRLDCANDSEAIRRAVQLIAESDIRVVMELRKRAYTKREG